MKADPLRILTKQLIAIKDQAEAALETVGLILDSEEDEMLENDVPSLPAVFNRRNKEGQTENKE